jgi:hypothetical protein
MLKYLSFLIHNLPTHGRKICWSYASLWAAMTELSVAALPIDLAGFELSVNALLSLLRTYRNSFIH